MIAYRAYRKTKKLRPAAAGILAAILYVLKIALDQAAQAAAGEVLPAWSAPIFTGLSKIAGAVIFLLLAYLAVIAVKRLVSWSLATADSGEAGQDESPADQDQARSLADDLARTVSAIERYGPQSEAAITDAGLQAAALVELVKALARKSQEMARAGEALGQALEAITDQNPAGIARAAGRVTDDHIRNLMLMPAAEVDPAYWTDLANLIAGQLGAAQRWQGEYSRLSGSLMAEVSIIKTRLTAAAAQIEAAQAARPLLQARNDLDQAGRFLKPAAALGDSPHLGRLGSGGES